MAPALQDLGDVESVAVAFEEVDAFADSLEHPKLDAVVDEFREVSRSWRSGVDVAIFYGESEQDRLDPSPRLLFAARHKAGAVAHAIYDAAGSGVHEADALLLEPA